MKMVKPFFYPQTYQKVRCKSKKTYPCKVVKLNDPATNLK